MNDDKLPEKWVIQSIADQAINIDFGEVIDAGINLRVTSLAEAIKQKNIPGITGYIPTYRSLTVSYDSVIISQTAVITALSLLLNEEELPCLPRKCWTIPVCYGGEQGIDLTDTATSLGISNEALIRIHSGQIYRIFMIGFVPGFAYLGGLDPRLHLPRRLSPRAVVPSGSISIGGIQSAIGSVAAPSGWHLIGRTPVRSFDPARTQPFLFSAGDAVKFEPVTEHEYGVMCSDRHFSPEWRMLP